MFVYMLFLLHVSFLFSPAKIQLFFIQKIKIMKIFLIFIFVWKCLYTDIYIFVVYFLKNM